MDDYELKKARQRAKYKSRRENHLCVECGEPVENGARCKKCEVYHTRYEIDRYRIKRE